MCLPNILSPVFICLLLFFTAPYFHLAGRWHFSLETLTSNDANGNENVKKPIGFTSKTTTLHVHHAFLYIFCPFLHDYDVKMPNSALYGGRKQAKTKFYLSFCTWIWSQRIQLREG